MMLKQSRVKLILLVSLGGVMLVACNLSASSDRVLTLEPSVPVEIPFTGIAVTRTPVPRSTVVRALLPTPLQFAPTVENIGLPPTPLAFIAPGSGGIPGDSREYAPVGERSARGNGGVAPVGQRCKAGTIPGGGGDDGRLPNTGPFASLYIRQDESCFTYLEIWGIDGNSQGYNAITIPEHVLNNASLNTPIATSDDGRIQILRNADGFSITVRLNAAETHVIELDTFPPATIRSYTRK